ncbi:MAG: hydroxymethylglutaryl-CoA lyase [Sphingomonadales bacterium]|nr:hydroxymethylglutaryl-CoA lyase [Sphingomonadales bacterium]
MQRSISIVEVGARDGLQNEPGVFTTDNKVALISRVLASGVRRLEVASFVNPKRVPQMADAEAVVAALPELAGISYIGLVLNMKGAERALATRVHELGAVVVASDTFGRKNQGQTIAEGIAEAARILAAARAAKRTAQVTISAAFGCPFEGEVPAARVISIAQAMADAGAAEIALADTIGAAVPSQVEDLVGDIRAALPGLPLRAHFHNTRNTGIANAYAAARTGVSTLDASLGGIGGCPFAPKATGNIPTEDLIYMLERSGFATSVNLEALISASRWLEETLGRAVPGLVSKAGIFPKPQSQAA